MVTDTFEEVKYYFGGRIMKRLFLFLLIAVFVLISTGVYAAERAPLGIRNAAVKFDYINFTEDELENSDVDKGLYVGIEGYGEIVPNLYLGTEVGYANPKGKVKMEVLGIESDVDTEITFVPIELNLKYAIKAVPHLVIDLGAGASFTYVKEDTTVSASGSSLSAIIDDWLFGGQFFADLNYEFGPYFIGINAKYQITEDFKNQDYNYNNWRIGGQIGVMF